MDINSAQEQSFVVNFVTTFTWIGYNRTAAGTFAWSRTGSPGNFTEWLSGEPNGAGGVEDCVEIRTKEGLWNDESCAFSKSSICKAGL